jgi:HEPN domain
MVRSCWMEKADQVKVLLKKARTDLDSMVASLRSGAPDGACSRAVAGTSKLFTAYLMHKDQPESGSQEIEQLLEQCEAVDDSFTTLRGKLKPMLSYIAESRADRDYFPLRDKAFAVSDAALDVREFIQEKVPKDLAQIMEFSK